MKVKRLLILILAFGILSIGVITATSPWGDYKGFPQVRVMFNGNEVSMGNVPGFIVDDTIVLPMRKLADSLQALVSWSSSDNTAHLYKPNVHMFAGKEVTKDGTIKQSFGKVQQGDNVSFIVFAQADSIEADIYSFKMEIVDPSGSVVGQSDETVLNGSKDSFWYPWPFEIKFNSYGEYKVQFLMKLHADSGYTVVSEKVIVSE